VKHDGAVTSTQARARRYADAWAKEKTRMGDDAAGPQNDSKTTRCIAIVGPFLSGKTTLLDALLQRMGEIPRQGSVKDGTTVGDSSAEARAHGMSVGVNIASGRYLDDHFTFIDVPGSVEFQHDGDAALRIADAAIVVTEPDPKRVPALQSILKRLEQLDVPHFLFLNKIDTFDTPVRDIVPVLQPASGLPLVLRQVPIWENGIATGYVDLASERAYVYREHAPSEIIDIPRTVDGRQADARFHMLEQIADYDDELMEQLLEDLEPPRDLIFDDLARELREGLICPVLLGSAEHGHGIGRLLKALRHEASPLDATLSRLGIAADDAAARAFTIKSLHTSHAGKVSIARVLTGSISDGETVAADGRTGKISGIVDVTGETFQKRGKAEAGEIVGFGRLDDIHTGDLIEAGAVQSTSSETLSVTPPAPVFAIAVGIHDHKDEVKLTTTAQKLCEEDPGLQFEACEATHQLLLRGQGEMHLRVAAERLKRKWGLEVETARPMNAYKETITKATAVRRRHKKQSGGHGQFGDVALEIKPLPRGSGFQFSDTIVGGAVPKQFIPSVEAGVRDTLESGPLGFEVVDVAVVLTDGSAHSVDSSDMAFRQAARLAMTEGLAECKPVLLEEVMRVEIAVPNEATPRVNAMISQRRGHILGFDGREGWPGWDVVSAQLPAAEIGDLIIELRSATAGAGTFHATFDHLAELSGRLADQVLAEQREAAE
jgi:elongation factor G